MIKIDPLYLLLLVELVCLLAGGLIFLLLRYKKYRAMYQSAIKDLVAAQHREQELQKQLVHARESVAAAPAPAPSGPTATLSLQNAQEIDDLKTKLQETEDSLREKKRKLEQEAPASAVTEALAPAEPEQADEPATSPVATLPPPFTVLASRTASGFGLPLPLCATRNARSS